MRRVVIIAIAVLNLTLAVGILNLEECNAQVSPAYLRVKAASGATLLLKFQNAEMRIAQNAKGLTKVKPIKMAQSFPDDIEFPEIDLPFPAQAVSGFSKVRACFVVAAPSEPLRHDIGSPTNYAFGHFAFVRSDSNKATWKYLVKIRAHTSPSPNNAPVVLLPNPRAFSLKVVARAEGKDIGVGLVIKSGTYELLNIMKSDQGAKVSLRVIDSNGRTVFSKATTADVLDFTEEEPNYSVRVNNPGTYTCEVTADGGPAARRLKGTARVIVR